MAVWNTINLSSLENFKDFSSEYYQKDHIQKSELIRRIGTVKVGKIAYITDGEHGSPCWSDTSGIKYITAEFIKENYIEQGQFRQISEEQDRRNIRTRLQSGDILIYSVGAYAGLAAVAEPHLFPANIPRSVAIIRINKKKELKSEYVATFLNSIFGKFQTLRLRAGNSQPVLALDKIKQLEIPIIEEKYQKEIQDYYQQAYKARIFSQSLYHQAEELLARELQLDQMKLPNKKWYSADYCEVMKERRMNAEFFSPDVYCILSQDFLKEAVSINDVYEIIRGYTPKCYYQSGVPIVKTKNVRTPNVDKKRISDYADFQEPLTQTKEKDLILAAMGVGSLGRISYVTDKETDCAIDGTLRILRKKDLLLNDIEIPTMLFLSTEIGQKLIYRGISGTTGIISLPDDYLGRIPIPVFEKSVRRKVTELVLNSIKAKNQSEQLLAQAKHRVEELIEQEANKY